MKKLIATLLLANALNGVKAQFYGEILYSHPTNLMSSGQVTNITSTGFLMATYNTLITPGPFVYNFAIDKTDDNGDFTLSTDFSNGYQIWDDANCSATSGLAQTSDCSGVSVIEINPVATNNSTAYYALAGTTVNGPFFALLGKNGVPLVDERFDRGSGPVNSIQKPYIVECTTTPNTYFVVGVMDNELYVIKVDSNGSIIWSNNYRAECGLDPRAIIECPYTGDLTIVGIAIHSPSANRASDGFFLKIDAGSGAINILNTYGHPTGACNEFFSINRAYSTFNGSDGFIIGGVSDPVSGVGQKWFIKLDPNGAILWSTLVEATGGGGLQPIVGVFERLNTSSQYEYFGVCFTGKGMTVIKMEESGIPFTGGNNEFWYDAPSANLSNPTALSCIISGGPSPNEGLQAYGVEQIAGGDAHLVSAYFNGASGCESARTTVTSYEHGPDSIIYPGIHDYPGMTACPHFQIRCQPLNTVPNYLCNNTSVWYGSNAKLSQIKNKNALPASINIYPNPNNGNFTIQVADEIKKGTLSVFNQLGQLVYSQDITNGFNAIETINLSKGIYHYTVTNNNLIKHTGKFAIE